MTNKKAVRPLRVGLAGLGQGAAGMLPSMAAMPEVQVVAGADLNPLMRDGFARRFPEARVYERVADLCTDPLIDAVYVGTPNRFHCEHTVEAMRQGKHVIVEKPMAISIEEANTIVDGAEKYGVNVAAAHTRSHSIWNRAMRRIALSGDIGRVRAIHVSAYTDWMLRPRTADELDTAQGGGVVFRQGPHQIDTVRLLGGGTVRSVRAMVGQWMPERPIPGYYCAYLEFEDGTPATIMHNGYGYYSMSEQYPWGVVQHKYTAENRRDIRRKLRDGVREEEGEKQELRIGGRRDPLAEALSGGPQEWSPFALGPVELTCERGFVRNDRYGLVVYDDNGRRDLDLGHLWRSEPDPSGGLSIAVLEEMYNSVILGKPLYHDAQWGRATLEVALAMNRSALDRREVLLNYQVAMPAEYDSDLLLEKGAVAQT
jgi:phthalate 4,5-cis-dihydrodiol dehydrogenase